MASNEEVLNHYGLVRLRVTGSANLKMNLLSLDEVFSTSLVPLTLASPTNIEPTRLCNFTQQRAQLEIYTEEIDETFVVSKVIIFVKPVAASLPG